jgi:hypothetical protein
MSALSGGISDGARESVERELHHDSSEWSGVVSEYSAEPLPHIRSGVRPDRIGL